MARKQTVLLPHAATSAKYNNYFTVGILQLDEQVNTYIQCFLLFQQNDSYECIKYALLHFMYLT